MMIGLADAGLPSDHPALVEAGEWVLSEEIRGPADWQVRRPVLAPGGWAFEFDNDNYPDTDDTAEVVLALRRVALPAAEAKPAIERGLRWLAGMQSKDGGWGAFDADNTRALVNKLPFCDFGAVIDPPSADVTAHIVEAFAAEGQARSPGGPPRRDVWLLRAQEPDGSWFGRWGANYVYGTGAVVPALIAAGVRPVQARHPPGRGLARRTTRTRTAGGVRTCAPTTTPRWRARHLHRVADRLGPARPARGGRARQRRHRAGHPLAGQDPAPRRLLGRAAVHGDRLPRRLLHQLPPVPPRVPPQRARPVRGSPTRR